MAKPKNPLLSLGARGTIGDALTYQKRGREHIVREKPIPKDPYSLNQAYQRWDYRDYAYQWILLSNSEKQVYRTKASRYHITGFSQFMRERLKDLTDLAGRWHLDEKGGAVAYDSSKNANNAAIIGASPADGWIDGGQYFDGLNDRIVVPGSASLDLTGDQTIDLFFNLLDTGGHQTILERGLLNTSGILVFITSGRRIQFYTSQAAASQLSATALAAFAWNTDHHLVITFSVPNALIYLDGLDITTIFGVHIAPLSTLLPTYIGTRAGLANWLKGTLDHITYYNRVLDQTEINRHSERRYPA